MRALILLGMLTFSMRDINTDQIFYTHTTNHKKITRKIINTHYPFTHFCLTTLGLINIVKGAGINIPVVRSCVEIKHVNFYRITAGVLLLTASRILHHFEQKDEDTQNE